jgi:hypothetical protein
LEGFMRYRLDIDGVASPGHIESAGPVLWIRRYEPGNGTSYDLEIFPRIGGGYLLAWDGGQVLARLYGGQAAQGGAAEVRLRSGELPDPDHRAIVALVSSLYAGGVLV